jgi:hypothetical protein
MVQQATNKQWMLGLPGHNEVVRLEDVVLLVKGGQLRPTDLVKKLGEPWRAANEIPELAEHFAEPRKTEPPKAPAAEPPPKPAPPVEAKATATGPVPKPAPVPTTSRIKVEPRPTQRAVKPPEPPPPVLTKPPDNIVNTPPEPAKEEAPPEKKRTRPIPRAPVRPKPILEPMIAKYFSPVDLLRSASFAFEPKKLAVSVALCVPLMVAWAFLSYFAAAQESRAERVLFIVSIAELILGVAVILTVLGYATRRQLEGKGFTLGDTIGFTTSNLKTALVYPVLVLLPSLFALGFLWILGLLRNNSPGMASTLKILYIVPMAFGVLFVLGAFVYQLASMYVPAAAAIEGLGLAGSLQAAWRNVKSQWGRVVLHWLIVTVAFGVITVVCLGLAHTALVLTNWIWSAPEDVKVLLSWTQFQGLFALYTGLAYGLGLALPMSLFSTLGALSYLSLRHPATAQLASGRPDETSGAGISRSGSSAPPDATQPAETRPAPPDATPPPDISDDSDEHPITGG